MWDALNLARISCHKNGSVRQTSKGDSPPIFVALTAMEEALTNAGILQIIFSYEGPGSWLFIPPVSKLWKHCYEQLDVAPLQRCYPEAHVTIRLTAYGAAFRSLSRFHMACEHGLQAYFATQDAQERAGAWCDVSTLLAAQKLGLKVTDSYIEYAAASGRLDVLKHLHTDQEVKLPTDVSSYAAAHNRSAVCCQHRSDSQHYCRLLVLMIS
jgi:hypothetical protein